MSVPDPLLVAAVAQQILDSLGRTESPLLGVLWSGFWEQAGRHKKSKKAVANTWARLNKHYRFPDGRCVAEMRAAEMTVGFQPVYRDTRSRQITRLGEPPTIATVNRELQRLRAVLNWAVAAGLIQPHPLCRMRMVPENNVRETKVRTDEEFQVLVRACAEEHYVLPALVLLYFDGGVRRLEGMRARWDELEIKPGGGARLRLSGRRTKTGKPRYAHLTRRTTAALLELPRVSEWVFANTHMHKLLRKPGPFYGKPYSPSYLCECFDRAVVASGLLAAEGEKITLHTLRHSFVYRARRVWRWPERVIMRQSGHTTRSVFDRYGITDEDEVDESMDLAEAAIEAEQKR